MSSMKDRLDADHAEAWRPADGDELIGEITDIGRRTTEWGTYTIITDKPEGDEPKAFHAFHTVAAAALRDCVPSIGDEIGIRYLGEIEAPKSKYGSYQGYKIVVDHPKGWSPMAVEDAHGQLDREAQEAAEADGLTPDSAAEDIPF